jgi:Asp-tRNA(Asn)/Glu-tRNA(Gln) amidotransferase C subunit
MLSPEEFKRLQTLANIKLSPEEQVKLGTQLDNIIQFIGQLDQIKITSKIKKKSGLTLRTIA